MIYTTPKTHIFHGKKHGFLQTFPTRKLNPWRFPNKIFPYKPSIFGYPHLWKLPYNSPYSWLFVAINMFPCFQLPKMGFIRAQAYALAEKMVRCLKGMKGDEYTHYTHTDTYIYIDGWIDRQIDS